MILLSPSLASVALRTDEIQHHKEKRLHEGGVGPEMRSPAGLMDLIMGILTAGVKALRFHNGRGHV